MKETKKGRKKKDVVETKFGIVFKNMNPLQKRSLNELLFATTDPSPRQYISQQSTPGQEIQRRLPDFEPKSDHLWIREITLRKNLESGTWEIGFIETNQGKFGTSLEQTSRIDQKQVASLVRHLREDVFEEDLKTFLENEKKDEK